MLKRDHHSFHASTSGFYFALHRTELIGMNIRKAINDAECIISASFYSNPLIINGQTVNLICGHT